MSGSKITEKVRVAYALVEDPKTGKFWAVRLHGARAERIEHLEPSERAEYAPKGIQRIELALEQWNVKRKVG